MKERLHQGQYNTFKNELQCMVVCCFILHHEALNIFGPIEFPTPAPLGGGGGFRSWFSKEKKELRYPK